MILTIDPSVAPNRTGWAVWQNGILTNCGKGSPHKWLTQVTDVWIEKPRIYPGGRTRNPQDVLELAFAAGVLAGRFEGDGAGVQTVEPRIWAGTIDANTRCRRVWARLNPFEQETAKAWQPPPSGDVPDSLTHPLDAIGIGLHVLGRLKR